MSKPIPFNYNGSSITFVYEGKTTILQSTFANYAKILAALKQGKWDEVATLANLKKFVTLASNGRVTILDDDNVYLDGIIVHNSLSERMVAMLKEGFSVDPLMRFLENLMGNPLEVAKEELYGFLEATNLPITEDGHFLAYKIVRKDYMDLYTGKINNAIGEKPSMPREQVDSDRTRTCSSGLHACSEAYLPHYGNQSNGDHVVVVKINPRDVVSIPADYNNAKMRVCLYEVVDELKEWGNRITPLYTSEYSSIDHANDESSDSSFADDLDDSWEDSDDEDETEEDSVGELDEILDSVGSQPNLSSSDGINEVEEAISYGITVEKLRQVRQVRKMGVDNWKKQAIADATGLSPRQVGRILSGEAWFNVK